MIHRIPVDYLSSLWKREAGRDFWEGHFKSRNCKEWPELKALTGITRFLEYANWTALAFLSLLVAYQVIARYILNDPSSWSEELARIVFIYLTFFGAALAIKRRRSLRITVFIERLPQKLRFLSYNLINGTITIGFLIVGVYYSYWLIQRLSASHTPSLELPISVLYISVPIGCLLMILYYLEEFTQKK